MAWLAWSQSSTMLVMSSLLISVPIETTAASLSWSSTSWSSWMLLKSTSGAASLVPISFTARTFVGGAYAASATTGEYAESVCNPNSLKVGVRVSYRSIEPEDDHKELATT